MTYHLTIGNRLYFSWSLSSFLLFNRFGLEDHVITTLIFPQIESEVGAALSDHPPARTVPTMITPEGAVVSDSMAIAEELASRHPDVAFWPRDPHARAVARSLANEMHSSFSGLRSDWPMNLRTAFVPVEPPDAITAELDRVETLFTHARTNTGSQTPWLCGDYSIVDAIFAPMAARLACHGLDTRPTTRAYIAAHLADPAFRRWRAMGLAKGIAMPKFESGAPKRPWPGPTPLTATATDIGPSENESCPYSGLPATHYLTLDGRTFGFCNAFCRDKTIADPEAWPAFMALLRPR